jgi:hypothetical protein
MMDIVFMADLNIPMLETYTGVLITLWGIYVWLSYGHANLAPTPKITIEEPVPTVKVDAV